MFDLIGSFFSWMIAKSKLPLVSGHVHWVAGGLAPHNLPIFTADCVTKVTAVIGRVEVPSSKPATLTLVKVSSGTPMNVGAPICGVMDAAGPAFTNQELALSADDAVLMLQPGDTIGVQATGAYTQAAGGITVHMIPLRK